MKKNLLFILLFFALGAFPLYGLLFYPARENTDNHTLAAKPELVKEGTVNLSFLSDAGDYFTDRFAGRQEFLTANALVKSEIFKESSVDIIVRGTQDHWLYYSASVKDETGENQASAREIANIVRTLDLTREYAEDNGMKFIFTVAPDKSSLYPEYIPYYCPTVSSNHVIDALTEKLSGSDLTYVDLYKLFRSDDRVLYHAGDSHWNNIGAAKVQNELLTALDKSHTDFTAKEPVLRQDFEGDLDKILFPLARHRETEEDYSGITPFNTMVHRIRQVTSWRPKTAVKKERLRCSATHSATRFCRSWRRITRKRIFTVRFRTASIWPPRTAQTPVFWKLSREISII